MTTTPLENMELPSNGAIAYSYAKLKACLVELIRLYDWRNEIGRIERDFNHDKKQVTTWLNKYGREKKAAWDIARNALAHAPDIDVLKLHERIQREAQARAKAVTSSDRLIATEEMLRTVNNAHRELPAKEWIDDMKHLQCTLDALAPFFLHSEIAETRWYTPDEKMPPHAEYVLGICAGRVFRCWYDNGHEKWHAHPHVTNAWDIKAWTPMPDVPKRWK